VRSRLGLGIAALRLIEQCPVIEAQGDLPVLGPQRLLPDSLAVLTY
jgi:hypothetical protein